jgi:hypothetical protein
MFSAHPRCFAPAPILGTFLYCRAKLLSNLNAPGSASPLAAWNMRTMLDLAMVVSVAVAFALTVAYARFCARALAPP